MRVVSALFALTLFASVPASAQDPVAVDAAHYSVIFENDQVRVLRIRYGPNEQGVMHSHPDGVAIYLDDINGEFTLPDGQVVNAQGKAREAVWLEAGSHQPRNLTDQSFELIQVELKEQPAAE
ncbi:MAG TPA: cytoplasmic protein [Gemmatimonadota bacterium]|nr:cytoplasmic protein [Gemmatimonadota bacterium]